MHRVARLRLEALEPSPVRLAVRGEVERVVALRVEQNRAGEACPERRYVERQPDRLTSDLDRIVSIVGREEGIGAVRAGPRR